MRLGTLYFSVSCVFFGVAVYCRFIGIPNWDMAFTHMIGAFIFFALASIRWDNHRHKIFMTMADDHTERAVKLREAREKTAKLECRVKVSADRIESLETELSSTYKNKRRELSALDKEAMKLMTEEELIVLLESMMVNGESNDYVGHVADEIKRRKMKNEKKETNVE